VLSGRVGVNLGGPVAARETDEPRFPRTHHPPPPHTHSSPNKHSYCSKPSHFSSGVRWTESRKRDTINGPRHNAHPRSVCSEPPEACPEVHSTVFKILSRSSRIAGCHGGKERGGCGQKNAPNPLSKKSLYRRVHCAHTNLVDGRPKTHLKKKPQHEIYLFVNPPSPVPRKQNNNPFEHPITRIREYSDAEVRESNPLSVKNKNKWYFSVNTVYWDDKWTHFFWVHVCTVCCL